MLWVNAMLAAGATSRVPHGCNTLLAQTHWTHCQEWSSSILISLQKQGKQDAGKVTKLEACVCMFCACFLPVAVHAGTGNMGCLASCFSYILKSNSTQLFLFLQFGGRRSGCALFPTGEMVSLGLLRHFL